MSEIETRDTVIIGSGPGGYSAAIRAAELGQNITLIEKEDTLGGVCLNVGCVPSKALIQAGHHFRDASIGSPYGITTTNPTIDFAKTQEWKQKDVVDRMTNGVKMLMRKHKVEVIHGEATMDSNEQLRVIAPGPKQFMSADNGRIIKFNNLILATGGRPVEIPGFKFEKRVVNSTGALALKEIPKELVVIGGGYVGSELAGAYADLGTHVTILEGTNSILPLFEPDLVKIVLKGFKNKGVDIITNARASEAIQDDNGVEVKYSVNGEDKTIKSDYVLVTVGRRVNTDEMGLEFTDVKLDDHGMVVTDKQGRSSVPNIYAIGDITTGPALAHKAYFQAKVAAGAISGLPTENDYVSVPSVAFTEPEVAVVGQTKLEAQDANLKVKTAQFPFAANARAVSLNQTDGFVRLVYTEDDKTVVGAQIVGPGASDLISELSLVVNGRMNVDDVALTIHPHPTLGEPIQEAAEIAEGFPSNI